MRYSNRGFGIVLVLVLSLVVGIMSFAFMRISNQSNANDVATHEKVQGTNLVQSGISYLKTELDDETNYKVLKENLPGMNEGSDLIKITGTNSGSLVVTSSVLQTNNFQDFKALYTQNRNFLKKGKRNFYIKELRCYVDDFKDFKVPQNFSGNYLNEKKGFIVIESTAVIDKRTINLKCKREFLVFNSKIPVLNHFTMFIREHNNNSETAYNTFKKNCYFKSNKDDVWKESNNMGLVLQNYKYSERSQPWNWGFVYIGKGDKYSYNGGVAASNPNGNIIYFNATNGELGGASYKINSKEDIVKKYSTSLMSDMFMLMNPRYYKMGEINATPLGTAHWSGDVNGKHHLISTEGIYKLLKRLFGYGTSNVTYGDFFSFIDVPGMSMGDIFNSFTLGFGENNLTLGFFIDSKSFGISGDAPKFEAMTDAIFPIAQKIFTDSINNSSHYQKSGMHLFGQFVWNKDIPFNTGTFVFGNVYSRFIQLGAFSNIQPNSTQYTFAENILKALLAMENGTSEKDAAFSKDMFFIIVLPEKHSMAPVAMGFHLNNIRGMFFDMVDKTISKFVRELLGKKRILKMAIKMLHSVAPTPIAIGAINPQNGQPYTTAEVTAMNTAISSNGTSMMSGSFSMDQIYNIAKKYNFEIFKRYPLGWSFFTSKPYVQILNKIYGDSKLYNIFKTKIVMQPYNKNFALLFEQNWWETQSGLYNLCSKIKNLSGKEGILNGDGSAYSLVLDKNFGKGDDDASEVRVSGDLSSIDFPQWVKARTTHTLIGDTTKKKSSAEKAEANWKVLIKYLTESIKKNNKNVDNVGEVEINKVIDFKVDYLNIGDGQNTVGIKKGGMIIVHGDVHIKSSIIKKDKNEILYIIAVKEPKSMASGNIYIETDKLVEAVLISFDGSIVSNEKINVRGMVCAKQISIGNNPNSLVKGGYIRYDSALRKDNMRVSISPNYKLWEEH